MFKHNSKNAQQDLEVSKDELPERWKHLSVKRIHRMTDEGYIVFTNHTNDDFDWEYDDNTVESDENFNREQHDFILSRMTRIKAKELNVANNEIIREFRELLSNVIANLYCCDYKNADVSLSEAESFILKHHAETTRVWNMVTTSIVSFIFVVTGFCLLWFEMIPNEKEIFKVGMYALFGGIGVIITTFMNLNKRYMLIESGRFRIGIESFIHSIVGILLAFLGLLLIKNNLVMTTLNDLPFPHSEILIAIIFASCEGFFPSFISNFDKSLINSEEKKNDI